MSGIGPDLPSAGPDSRPARGGVRFGEITDAAAVAQVQVTAWTTDYQGVLPEPVLQACLPEVFERRWAEALSTAGTGHRLLVALDASSVVVGMAAIGPSADPDRGDRDAEITTLEVDSTQRGQGHGARLLTAAADAARVAGMTRLLVWVWLVNEPVRAFFQSAGFGPDQAWRDRVVDADGGTLRQVRLVATLDEPGATEDAGKVAVR